MSLSKIEILSSKLLPTCGAGTAYPSGAHEFTPGN